MHILGASAASYILLLFLMQAHNGLLCTFTTITIEEMPWDKVVYSKTISAQNEGGCLKQCLEDFPECSIVATDKVDKWIYCFLYYERSTPLGLSVERYVNYTGGENIYRLERGRSNTACPPANTVLPV
nr:unnamed protein product [Haemonchus contortus]